MTLALYYFLCLYKDRNNRKKAELFFIILAFAFLVKGPIGLIIPLLIVTIFCLLKRENVFGLRNILIGIAIFAIVVVPWFYLIYKIYGQSYLDYIWSREILQRLGRGYTEYFIIRYIKGVYFYARTLIVKFLPYSLFIPAAIINTISVLSNRFLNKYAKTEKDGHLFLILWIVIVFLFFTFVAEKRAHYLLALSPAISILLGIVFKYAVTNREFFSKTIFKVPYLTTFVAIVFLTIIFILSEYISSENKIYIWKFGLIIIPVIFALGYRYRNTNVMPLSFVCSLSLLYVTMVISQPFGLFTNKMQRAAMIIKSEFQVGDRIGIGSHGIIPEELQVFFKSPIESVKVMYRDDGSPNLQTASQLRQFLNAKERVFCVIKRKDYNIFIPEEMKKNSYILGRYYVWKRRIRFDKELEELLAGMERRSSSIREIFQNEIYIISNRAP
jgi:4-amino-4-deoxy-L-arabinose transferase-like glycosyltransferase